MLAYLATNADQPQPRDRLMGLLWSDRAERQARQSLNAALNALRRFGREIDLEFVDSDREMVGLVKHAIDIDVQEFRELVKARSADAAELYRGYFMDGFAAPDPAFEEWLLATRSEFHSDACTALRTAAEHAARNGKPHSAIELMERLLQFDPLLEDAHREIILLKSRVGDRTGALRQFEACSAVLKKELGVEPDPETQRLYEDVVDGRMTVTVPTKQNRSRPKRPDPGSQDGSALVETGANHTEEIGRLRSQIQKLETELEETTTYQAATSTILQLIREHPDDLLAIFQAIVSMASRLCDSEYAVFYKLFDDKYLPVAAESTNPEWLQYLHDSPTPAHRGSLAGRAGIERRTLHLEDVLDDPEYTRIEAQQLGKYRSMLAIPILREGETIAVIVLLRSSVKPFSRRQIELAETFANQATIAILNAHLLEQLESKTRQLSDFNKTLQGRVDKQVHQLDRVRQLRRFLPKGLAELVISTGDDTLLQSHRREVAALYCDLREFTAFSEQAQPEEVMAVLREYHSAAVPIIETFEGTLERYRGDGLMVLFNDPFPCDDPADRAIGLAIALRKRMKQICSAWQGMGRRLSFGVAISHGYATLGSIGFENRLDYTAIGPVVSQAVRLCDEARPMEILLTQSVAQIVKEQVQLEEIGELSLRGLRQPVICYRLPESAT